MEENERRRQQKLQEAAHAEAGQRKKVKDSVLRRERRLGKAKREERREKFLSDEKLAQKTSDGLEEIFRVDNIVTDGEGCLLRSFRNDYRDDLIMRRWECYSRVLEFLQERQILLQLRPCLSGTRVNSSPSFLSLKKNLVEFTNRHVVSITEYLVITEPVSDTVESFRRIVEGEEELRQYEAHAKQQGRDPPKDDFDDGVDEVMIIVDDEQQMTFTWKLVEGDTKLIRLEGLLASPRHCVSAHGSQMRVDGAHEGDVTHRGHEGAHETLEGAHRARACQDMAHGDGEGVHSELHEEGGGQVRKIVQYKCMLSIHGYTHGYTQMLPSIDRFKSCFNHDDWLTFEIFCRL